MFARRVLDHVGQEPQRRSSGKIISFCACTSLSTSACIVPRSLGTTSCAEPPLGGGDVHRQQDRRGAVDRHRDREVLVVEREAGVEPVHVVDGVDGHAPLADLAEDAVGVAVQAVERRAVERGAQRGAALLLGEIMEAAVGVFGQAQAGEEPRRLFREAGCRCPSPELPRYISAIRRRSRTGIRRAVLRRTDTARSRPARRVVGSASRGSFKPVGVVVVANLCANALPIAQQFLRGTSAFGRWRRALAGQRTGCAPRPRR